jgi:hypothetical protein
MSPAKHEHGAKDFEEVRARELEYIRLRQAGTPAALGEGDASERLIGLAFSGGGIRSATTNLGVLQALSRMGVLRLVDYLSTVSGGGYIGGCLASILSVKRSDLLPSQDQKNFDFTSRTQLRFSTEWKDFPFRPLREPTVGGKPGEAFKPGDSERIVAHLRTHGDFLIARRSIFKREALRAVGNLVAGILYTALLTVLTLAVISLLLLGAAHTLSRDVTRWDTDEDRNKVEASLANTELQYLRGESKEPEQRVREATDPVMSDHFSHRVGLIWDDMTRDIRHRETGAAVAAGFVVSVLVLAIFLASMKWWEGQGRLKPGENRDDAFEIPLLRLSAGLLWAAAIVVPIVNLQVDAGRTSAAWLLQPFFVLAGAYVTAFLAYSLVFAWGGFKNREVLWSRRSRSLWGSYLAITLYGTLFALLFAALPAASYAAHAVGLKGVLAPVGSLVVGRLLMTRAVAGNAERFALSKTVFRVLLALVAAGLIGFTMIEVGALAIDKGFVDPLGPDGWLPYAKAVGVAVIALAILCYTVNLNRIGLHYFYRDRILETYLRSEVESTSTSGGMTPFISTMEMRLQDVHGNGNVKDGLGNTSPYLLVSAALNLAGSRDLTRKDRKSGYFLFSKYYCGSKQTRYRETKDYLDGKTQLARALTVSGAAAGTGMGYQTFFAQSFLAAVFNIRLGQWISNPRTNKKEKAFWPLYILREALGATNERTKLVNVSDGGHTGDNVGIYPLLERRCQVIIASDAEADPAIGFGSFTEALRHAYVDLGVDVDIDLSMIMPDPKTGWSQSHCAIGRIRYPECPGRPNWIIYMKNSLTGNEPAPVLNYKRSQPAFPHESTADQFFDDAQFESYRALGDHIAEETFARWAADPEVRVALGLRTPILPERDCASVNRQMMSTLAWDELRIRHSPFRAADNEQFGELTNQVKEMEQLFLETPDLRWYYLECMGLADPDPNADRQQAVNVVAMQIQLMEDSYFALRLDRYANARDNRGWMNLFRRWGRSPTFQEYFKKLKSNYSLSFVAFYCDYIEDWGEIDAYPVPHAWDVRETAHKKYEHPSARECRRRRAGGIFQDGGRIEAGEEEDGVSTPPPESAAPGQHGGARSQTESLPPTPPESNE